MFPGPVLPIRYLYAVPDGAVQGSKAVTVDGCARACIRQGTENNERWQLHTPEAAHLSGYLSVPTRRGSERDALLASNGVRDRFKFYVRA